MAAVTYLKDAVKDRIVPMLKEVSAEFDHQITRVVPYFTRKQPTPSWMVYMPASRRTDVSKGSQHIAHQNYTLMLRLALAPAESGYTASNDEFLNWMVAPTVYDYFDARRGLCYLDGQTVPSGLIDHMTAITQGVIFGMFPEDGDVYGIEFQLTLVFQRLNESVYNNP